MAVYCCFSKDYKTITNVYHDEDGDIEVYTVDIGSWKIIRSTAIDYKNIYDGDYMDVIEQITSIGTLFVCSSSPVRGDKSRISLIDIDTCKEKWFRMVDCAHTPLCITPDGAFAAYADGKAIKVWSLANRAPV